MIRHWNRHLRTETDPGDRGGCSGRGRSTRSGSAMTATVLVIVLVTKFLAGAWIAILAMVVHLPADARHPSATTTGSPSELELDDDATPMLPSRVHAIVLVSKVHKPTLRAIAYARARGPTLEALTVDVDQDATDALHERWDERGIPVPLKVLESPYREIARPIIDYVQGAPQGEPARRRDGLHPRVRRRPLVGAAAAQPERAAAQGPPAVHAGRDGHERARTSCARPARRGRRLRPQPSGAR